MIGFFASVFKKFRKYVNNMDIWRFMGCDEMLHKCWGSWLESLQGHCQQVLDGSGDCTSPQGRQGILPLYLALVRYIRSAGCCSGLPSAKETWVQWSRCSKGLWRWSLPNEGRLRENCGCSSWSWRIFRYWCGTLRRVERRKTRSFLVVSSDWMRRNGHKLKYKKLHLNVRENKIFFPLYGGLVKHWSRFPTALGSCHLWRCLVSDWVWSWAAYLSWPKQGQTQWSQAVPVSLHLLWFSDLLAL